MLGNRLKKPIVVTAILGSFVALTAMASQSGIDHEIIKSFFGEAAGNQMAQAGFFFTMAAWIHAGRVKKEIKSNFLGLTTALNNIADSFREDLKKHSERLDNLSSRIENIENNIQIK
jgi:hypothetical protein